MMGKVTTTKIDDVPPSGDGGNGTHGNVDARKLVAKFYRETNYLLRFASAQNILNAGVLENVSPESHVLGYPSQDE